MPKPNDTRFFSDAFLAYCYRTNYAGSFQDLPIVEMSIVLRDAQTLKVAAQLQADAIAWQANQPMYEGEFSTTNPAEVGKAAL